jgi:hypothetical protein
MPSNEVNVAKLNHGQRTTAPLLLLRLVRDLEVDFAEPKAKVLPVIEAMCHVTAPSAVLRATWQRTPVTTVIVVAVHRDMLILTQKAVLDLGVDLMQPLLRAVGLLLMRHDPASV